MVFGPKASVMKKRIHVFLSASLLSLAALSQDPIPTTPSATFHRWQLGANASADYCYRMLQNNDGSDGSASTIDFRNSYEVAKIGYTAGLNVCYNISKRYAIEAGLQYSNKGYKLDFSSLTFGDIVDPRKGNLYNTDSIATYEAKENFTYLDIPIRFILSLGNKRCRFVSSIGVTANIFLQATHITLLKYEDGNTSRNAYRYDYDFKSVGITPTISFGADYDLSNRFCLRAEPTFRYGLVEIIDEPIAERLWSAGLNVTCYYTLR